jgi:quercetin dioxygenase-like cupin family protein
MRILDLQIPPGDRSWFHTHEWPVLYMTLGRSTNRIQNLGEDWSGGGPPAAGAPPRPPPPATPRATSTTSYAQQPVTHRLENVGDNLFRAMVVVNETHGDDSRSVEAAGFSGTPELTNAWFRSYRVTLPAGAKTPPHRHAAPVVIFQATEGKGIAAGPMKFELNEPGQWAFFDAATLHDVQNLGSSPLEVLEIEVRRK